MSTFRELYDDFRAEVLLYVERAEVTEFVFMRYLTRGIQIFQRRTEYVVGTGMPQLHPNASGANALVWQVPADMLRAIEVFYTPTGDPTDAIRCVLQEYDQFIANVTRDPIGRLETPVDYSYWHDGRLKWISGNYAPLATIYADELHIYPPQTSGSIILRYVPDLHAISSASPQWAPWFPLSANFIPLFNSAHINPRLAPYERTFVAYSLSIYLRSKGAESFLVYEREFEQGVQEAILNKASYFREAQLDYAMAPWV
ncbi:MAG: hypothetical protein QXO86_01475 [Nitrososphaerota archaeon]